MNETRVTLTLDTRISNKRKDDTYPLKIRLRHKGKNELISLGKNFSVKITEWNDKKGEVRSTNKNGLELRLKCINSLKIAQEVIDLNVYLIDTLTSKQVAGLIKEGIKKPYNALKPKSQKDIMV